MRLFRALLCEYSRLPKSYANFPESYIKKCLKRHRWLNPKAKNYNPEKEGVIRKRPLRYDMERPWEGKFDDLNAPNRRSNKQIIYVEPFKEFPYFMGDHVIVLRGKDKGKIGKVNYIVKERNWLCVENLNCEYEMLGKSADYPGTMVKMERPLLINRDVIHVDPSDNKPTKVLWRFTEKGEKVRVSERTGLLIPLAMKAFETYDYKDKKFYIDKAKDTLAADAEAITFKPMLATVEQELMESMGIKEHVVPKKTFWY